MTITKKPQKPELLAPAGSLESFFAAMENGADAVYAGLRDFSARAKAKNFTLSQMERITAYAHAHGRKVFATLNTLVKEKELPELVETLSALENMRVDGVILQDMAVYRLIRDHFPGLSLHASTQMTIHNSLGAKQLEQMGFSRIVLARELHLDDIRSVVNSTSAEIEIFIHGALCFSISGQCYFSSFLGGHSGNRGRCAQPCRRQYRYKGKEGYYFSTNDFSTIDLIPQIMETGVASLKIEGRMKSAEYVARVVGAYRRVIDAPPGKSQTAIAEAKELLKLSFGRTPTKGFLASRNPPDIATPHLTGSTGRFLGEIRSIKGTLVTFETRDRLHVGDRIRVQPKTDMPGKGLTVKELFRGKDKVMSVKEKTVVTVPIPFACRPGDAVFRVSSETAFTMSEQACMRKLASAPAAITDVALVLSHANDTMIVQANADGQNLELTFPLGPLEAARTTDMEGVLRAQFSRTGDTSFRLVTLAAPDFPAIAIPPARLKDIRRETYRLIEARLGEGQKKHRIQARAQALAALVPAAPVHPAKKEELAVHVPLRDWQMLHHPSVTSVIFPITKASLHQLPQTLRKLRGHEEKIIWHLPFFIQEADLAWYRDALAALRDVGFNRFEASNLGHLPLLQGVGEISADYRLFSVNSQAMETWRELGLSRATLYMEDDADNMADLLAANVQIQKQVLAFAPVPAIISKIPIKGVKPDAPVISDRGDAYLVTERDGLTTVTPAKPFSLTGFHDRLRTMGCSSYVLDLTAVDPDGRKRVIDAFLRSLKLQDTSEFNFTAGLT